MKKIFRLMIAGAALALASCAANAQSDIDKKVEDLLGQMTLREKVGQMNQLSGGAELAAVAAKGEMGSVLNCVDVKELNAIQKAAVEESRLGIPVLISRDVIHGFRTMFPIPLGQAATFDPAIVEKGARISAVEATANGIRWTFSPMLDIARDPRWGRVAEGAGEDPYLDVQMGVAMVKGYQGEDLSDPTSMAACIKHFVGYGAAEGGRDYNSTMISERSLRNTYFPAFKATAEAGAATLMTSFNEIDGIPSTGNKWLLKDILRDEWGFEGLVMRSPTKEYGIGKRSSVYMIKLKNYRDMEVPVRGYELGLRGIEDMVFICEATNGKSFKAKPWGNLQVKKDYVENFESYYKDKLVKIKFFYFSDNDNQDTGVPLQPSAIAFRDLTDL